MAYKEYILHNGRTKEIHGRYSNMIMYKEVGGGIKSITPHEAVYCDAMGVPFPGHIQASMKGQEVVKETALIQEPLNQGMTVKIGNNNPVPNPAFQAKPYTVPDVTPLAGNNPLGENGSSVDGEVYNLNEVTTDADIRKVASAVSGLGYKTLKTIVENRPATGYQDVEHLREVNGSRIPKNLKWSVMEPFISF